MPSKPPTISGSGDPRKHGRGSRWHKVSKTARAIEPLCRLCLAAGRSTPAVCVDHIVPLASGGASTPDNLQPLCKACHARKTAADTGAGKRGPWAARISILVGPPGAGKSTAVKRVLSGNDLVYDFDALAEAISRAKGWTSEALALSPILRRMRDALIASATDGMVQGRLWVLMSDLEQATSLQGSIPGSDLMVLATPTDLCLEAIRARRLAPERERDAALAVTRFAANLLMMEANPAGPLRAATILRQRGPLPAQPTSAEPSGADPAPSGGLQRPPSPPSPPFEVGPSKCPKPSSSPWPRRHESARTGSPPFPPHPPAPPSGGR